MGAIENSKKESALKGGRSSIKTHYSKGTLPEFVGGGQVPADALQDVHSMPKVPFGSWPNESDKKQPLNTIPNLEHLLNHYGFMVRYNVIQKALQVRFPGQRGTLDNYNSVAINEVVSLCGLNRLPKSEIQSFLLNIGDRNPFNPVMDFIQSKPWDGRSRFTDLLNTIKTRPGYSRELLALLLRRWLISAVAAAAKPSGFKSKGVLVFQGQQSIGKTAWISNLLPKELRDLIKIDAMIDPNSKDTIISACSHWVVELGELDGTLRKADIARLKGFISQDVDQFRRPYGRAEEKFQRRTVFFASVNPQEFLADDTGNVRWWTVPVIGLNYEHGINMQQLWAEVFEWFKAGEKWWLNQVEEALLEAVNDNYQQSDPIEELILKRYGGAIGSKETEPMTATDVLLKIGYDRPTKAQLNVSARVLRKLLGEPKHDGKRRVFYMPLVRDNQPHYDENQPF